MGAKCSRNSKVPYHSIVVTGVDMYDRLQMEFLRIHPGDVPKQVPRIAWTINEVTSSLSSYGGRSPLRPILERVYKNTDGLVYIVDSTSETKLEEDLGKFNTHILKDDASKNLVMMILTVKQEQEGALSTKEIENKVGEILSTHDIKLGGRTLIVKGCNTETNMGLEEAFSQFAQLIPLHQGGLINPGLQTFTAEELNALGKKENNSRLHSLKKVFDMSYMKSVLLY